MALFILTAWQMCRANQVLITFVNTITTMPHIVLYTHVSTEFIFNVFNLTIASYTYVDKIYR